MEIWENFRHCPRCGTSLVTATAHRPPDQPAGGHDDSWPPPLHCASCQFTHYFNPICAVGMFLLNQEGKCLFIRRGREPGKGKLAPPGGFIDLGETAEVASRREIREEVGLEFGDLHYIGSWPNRYHTRDHVVDVLDFFYWAEVTNDVVLAAEGEVEGHEWLDPLAVEPDELAFTSMHQAHAAFREIWSRRLGK